MAACCTISADTATADTECGRVGMTWRNDLAESWSGCSEPNTKRTFSNLRKAVSRPAKELGAGQLFCRLPQLFSQ
eukprot:scaffold93099_cov66-Phaeocystis_antarctica.AAC.2